MLEFLIKTKESLEYNFSNSILPEFVVVFGGGGSRI